MSFLKKIKKKYCTYIGRIKMSCQFKWNFKEYKINENLGKEITIVTASAPVSLVGVENNTLKTLRGHLVLDTTKTNLKEIDDFQENYNIIFTIGTEVVGSLYVVTGYQQPKSDSFETELRNIKGTVSCKGLFSEFNNGLAIIEYDNETKDRRLCLYPKN